MIRQEIDGTGLRGRGNHVLTHRGCAAATILAATLLFSFVPAAPASAQLNALDDAIVEEAWATVQVAPGVRWRSHQFDNLLGLPQFVSLLEVDLDGDRIRVDVVRPDSGRALTSELAERSRAVAAVNGSYFEMDGTASLFFQDDGVVLRADDDGNARIWEDGAVATELDGDATIVRRGQPAWHALAAFADVLVSGPLLVWDGEIHESTEVGFNLTHHPRTAAGVTSDNRLLLVTVDGRSPQSAGLTVPELALLMQALGCETALNLDGGGSTTMWVQGDGVVNHPSDNGAFDAAGERAVANAVVVVVNR